MSIYPRDRYLQVLQAAVSSQEYRFAREAALNWLASFPGDLKACLLYAKTLIAEEHYPQAMSVLTNITGADPEYLEAAEVMLRAEKNLYGHFRSETLAAILALDGSSTLDTVPSWGRQLALARQTLAKGDVEKADSLICLSLAGDADSALVATTHLLILEANPDVPLAAKLSLGELYHQRYPGCVTPMVMLADWLMKSEETERAVALLHQASVLDVGGQVPTRLWGHDHPYHVMWPEWMEVDLPGQIPAAVAAVLGWNRLGNGVLTQAREMGQVEGEQLTPSTGAVFRLDATVSTAEPALPIIETTETMVSTTQAATPATAFQAETAMDEDLAAEEPRTVEAESHQTGYEKAAAAGTESGSVYILFSTNTGLVQQYNAGGATAVRAAMNETARVIGSHPGWKAMVFLPDDAQFMAQIGLKPANAGDAWQLKLSLLDLETILRTRNLNIGAVLIVGGPEVVPYHDLPNPVDDDDLTVPSDSPYASSDENYFIPEWPLGRLPGGAGSDPSFLITALKHIQSAHSLSTPVLTWQQRLWNWILRLFGRYAGPSDGNRRYSLALTAAVWRKASQAVFQPVGEGKSLAISPPVDLADVQSDDTRAIIPLPSVHMAYFNLHGMADNPDWYGHRDPVDSGEGKDYPTALRPQDAAATTSHPIEIIFSEACYGGHIINKHPSQAVILRFLEAGTRAIAASSCISYGSISTPLIAADLLGFNFWKLIRAGKPAGLALQQAKIQLVAEMNSRQGYLDGEDQKTLISFILFGDPMASLTDLAQSGKQIQESSTVGMESGAAAESIPVVKTVCDRTDEVEMVPGELMTYVKRVVHQYLPGMEGAEVTMSHEHPHCYGEHACPTGKMKDIAHPEGPISRKLVLLSKPVIQDERVHYQYARLTLDASGKLVKLAVSR